MNCTYSININGKTLTVLENVTEDIKDITDLERLLKKQSSPEKLKEIRDALREVDKIEELRLDDINENSIGLYSPADLINNLSKNMNDARLLKNLTISKETMSSKIVVAGFGKESVPTQYVNGHVFLNLNYLYDYDNKIIALTELAVKSKFPNLTGKEVIADDEKLRQIIDTENEDRVRELTSLIKSAYSRAALKLTHDLSESKIDRTRENPTNVYNQFKNEDRLEKYAPKSRVRVENLRQGDLVLIPTEGDYKNGVYEMFYDSYVDVEGNTIMRTLVDYNGETEIRNRISQVYARDGQVVTIRPSDVVEAKLYSPEVVTDIPHKEGQREVLKVKFSDNKSLVGITYGDSILNMIKAGADVITGKKTPYKVVKIEGSNIHLENGKVLKASEIRTLSVLVNPEEASEIPESEATLDNGWTRYNDAIIGERIAFKKEVNSEKLTVATVIGVGIKDNKSIVYYNDGNTVGHITESNIRYMSNPPIDYTLSTTERVNANATSDLIKDETGKMTSVKDVMLSRNSGLLKNSKYSIQDVNKYSQITPKDILVDRSGIAYKVVSTKGDRVKLTQLIGN